MADILVVYWLPRANHGRPANIGCFFRWASRQRAKRPGLATVLRTGREIDTTMSIAWNAPCSCMNLGIESGAPSMPPWISDAGFDATISLSGKPCSPATFNRGIILLTECNLKVPTGGEDFTLGASSRAKSTIACFLSETLKSAHDGSAKREVGRSISFQNQIRRDCSFWHKAESKNRGCRQAQVIPYCLKLLRRAAAIEAEKFGRHASLGTLDVFHHAFPGKRCFHSQRTNFVNVSQSWPSRCSNSFQGFSTVAQVRYSGWSLSGATFKDFFQQGSLRGSVQ